MITPPVARAFDDAVEHREHRLPEGGKVGRREHARPSAKLWAGDACRGIDEIDGVRLTVAANAVTRYLRRGAIEREPAPPDGRLHPHFRARVLVLGGARTARPGDGDRGDVPDERDERDDSSDVRDGARRQHQPEQHPADEERRRPAEHHPS